ncbi:MAG: OadG family protein [Atopostipes sp.]|nr:OadG family protein [Atopostipes sp.]
MESISLGEGLVLTVVSMLLVFLVLAAIGLLINLVSKFVGVEEPEERRERNQVPVKKDPVLEVNDEHQFVAEMMALVLASEDQPDRKFEIVESKRIK